MEIEKQKEDEKQKEIQEQKEKDNLWSQFQVGAKQKMIQEKEFQELQEQLRIENERKDREKKEELERQIRLLFHFLNICYLLIVFCGNCNK